MRDLIFHKSSCPGAPLRLLDYQAARKGRTAKCPVCRLTSFLPDAIRVMYDALGCAPVLRLRESWRGFSETDLSTMIAAHLGVYIPLPEFIHELHAAILSDVMCGTLTCPTDMRQISYNLPFIFDFSVIEWEGHR